MKYYAVPEALQVHAHQPFQVYQPHPGDRQKMKLLHMISNYSIYYFLPTTSVFITLWSRDPHKQSMVWGEMEKPGQVNVYLWCSLEAAVLQTQSFLADEQNLFNWGYEADHQPILGMNEWMTRRVPEGSFSDVVVWVSSNTLGRTQWQLKNMKLRVGRMSTEHRTINVHMQCLHDTVLGHMMKTIQTLL